MLLDQFYIKGNSLNLESAQVSQVLAFGGGLQFYGSNLHKTMHDKEMFYPLPY